MLYNIHIKNIYTRSAVTIPRKPRNSFQLTRLKKKKKNKVSGDLNEGRSADTTHLMNAEKKRLRREHISSKILTI